jgi:hypothetical protein
MVRDESTPTEGYCIRVSHLLDGFQGRADISHWPRGSGAEGLAPDAGSKGGRHHWCDPTADVGHGVKESKNGPLAALEAAGFQGAGTPLVDGVWGETKSPLWRRSWLNA